MKMSFLVSEILALGFEKFWKSTGSISKEVRTNPANEQEVATTYSNNRHIGALI